MRADYRFPWLFMFQKNGSTYFTTIKVQEQNFVEFSRFGSNSALLAGISQPKNIDGTAVSGKFSDASKIKNKNTTFNTLIALTRNMT